MYFILAHNFRWLSIIARKSKHQKQLVTFLPYQEHRDVNICTSTASLTLHKSGPKARVWCHLHSLGLPESIKKIKTVHYRQTWSKSSLRLSFQVILACVKLTITLTKGSKMINTSRNRRRDSDRKVDHKKKGGCQGQLRGDGQIFEKIPSETDSRKRELTDSPVAISSSVW